MFRAILGKDKAFFELFEKASTNVCKGAEALHDLIQSYPEAMGEKAGLIKDIEHEGDQITHQTIEMVNKTFVTPIDREDIHLLITKLDDVIDLMETAASRLVLYKIQAVTKEARAFGDLLVKTTGLLHKAVCGFRNLKNSKEMIKHCVEINTLENEGDQLKYQAMVNLFEQEKDNPINVIKWKEIYEELETATDCCEDVANVIEGIILKNV